MLKVFRSNRLEELAEALAEVLRSPLRSPFDTEWIAVSSQTMRTWLSRELSLRLGVWSGARFPFPREMMDQLLAGASEDPRPVWDPLPIRFGILALLPEMTARPEFEEIRRYLEDDRHDLKRVQLAGRIAHTFDEYILYRPEMILAWEEGLESHWQAVLWRRLKQRYDFRHIAGIAREVIDRGTVEAPALRRVSFFAVSLLPPLYFRVLSALEDIEIDLFAISPSKEWWADIKTGPRPALTADLTENPELERLFLGNPVLSSLGRLARDFQWILEASAQYDEPGKDRYVDPGGTDRSLLQTVQSDILNLRYPAPLERPSDGSIRVHSCHSRMREVEVLKDQLLDLFEASEGAVGPDDVAVLAPDIEEYVPFIDAVFGGDGELPFTVATGAYGQSTPAVNAALHLLDLCGSRLTVNEVFDLLMNETVRARFGFDEDEVIETRRWIAEAGVRWGMDGAHRGRFDQPEKGENTWRFGLDRLLLGVALLPENRELFRGVSPVVDLDSQAAEVLGRLAVFLETLFEHLRRLTEPRPVAEWTRDIEAAIHQMIARTETVEAEYRVMLSTLADIAREASVAEFDAPLDFGSVRSLVQARFRDLRIRRGWYPGGVSFSSLLPMRSIPFQVIYLLGMNEREFPRNRSAPAFDLMAAHPRIGDRSTRTDDRHLFLEALLQTRRTLVISCVGQSIKDGSAKPRSVLVRDLLETLASGYGCAEEALVTAHPLQPFSPRYFDAARDEGLFSYSDINCENARATLSAEKRERPFFSDALAAEPTLEVDLEALCRFFQSPARYLMRQRVGALYPRRGDAIPKREPISANGPDDRNARRLLLELLLEGTEREVAFDHLHAQGLLPLGRAGRSRFDSLAKQLDALVARTLARQTGERSPPVELDLSLETYQGEVRIQGVIDRLWPDARVVYSLWPLSGRTLLDAWIRLLALHAAGLSRAPERSVIVSRKQTSDAAELTLGAPADAQRLLADLLDLFRLGNEVPLPLLPDTSYRYCEERTARKPTKTLDLGVEWNKQCQRELAVATAFRGVTPFDWEPLPGITFDALSWRVFGPLLDARR